MLGFERSIVSDVPGTTRDFITSGFLSGGFSFDLIDTAGLRITKDDIESSGISFAKKELKEADGVVIVVDHKTLGELDNLRETVVSCGVENIHVVLNKSDLKKPKSLPGHYVSALTGENFSKLRNALADLALSLIHISEPTRP